MKRKTFCDFLTRSNELHLEEANQRSWIIRDCLFVFGRGALLNQNPSESMWGVIKKDGWVPGI